MFIDRLDIIDGIISEYDLSSFPDIRNRFYNKLLKLSNHEISDFWYNKRLEHIYPIDSKTFIVYN